MVDVAVVDDHALIAETLRLALTASGLDACAIAPRETPLLLGDLLAVQPKLVLLDLDLGVAGSGTALIAPLVAAGVRVLLVTGVVDRTRVAEGLEQGALGYQTKAAGFTGLLAKAAEALTCSTALDLEHRCELLEELGRERATRARTLAPFKRLTDREQHTLRALAQGHSVHDIAQRWVVSEATVRTHVRGVLTKLGAPSQLAAVALAIDGGWLVGAPVRVAESSLDAAAS